MASIIKNQILKHLTKFAKNLTADKINVDVLRGKGELKYVELNEDILSSVLEFPAFLKVKKAVAIRIGVFVPWTRLKSQPIKLFIDEIQMEVEMSSDLRKPTSMSMAQSALSAYSDNSYGFANRVAEGISFYINTLEINFTSEKFCGSFMLSRLSVESTTPAWTKPNDLRKTRISDHTLNEALLFKQVTWQLLRVEASAMKDDAHSSDNKKKPSGNISAPLRLITSQGKCRITVKKSTKDGSVINGRIQVILDDILWVATLPQIKSAIDFYRYILGLIQKAGDSTKIERAKKVLQKQKPGIPSPQGLGGGSNSPNINNSRTPPSHPGSGPGSRSGTPSQLGSASTSAAAAAAAAAAGVNQAFRQFDIAQTSYHLYVAQIDLHLCDDTSAAVSFPDNWQTDNGALQISLRKLAADAYPYHLANGDRKTWVRYRKTECIDWIRKLLDHYHNVLASKLGIRERAILNAEWGKLMAASVVLRIDDLTIQCVSESTTRREDMEDMVSSDREICTLPGEQPLIHAEFTDFYYAGNSGDLPTPPSCSQLMVSPIRVLLDQKSLRWIHYIYTDVVQALDLPNTTTPETGGLDDSMPHTDVRIEAVMPRLIIPSAPEHEHIRQPKKPSRITVHMSSLHMTNSLVGDSTPRNHLRDLISQLEDSAAVTQLNPLSNLNPALNRTIVPTQTRSFKNYLTHLCEFMPTPMSTGPNSPVMDYDGSSANSGMSADEMVSLTEKSGTDYWCIQLSPIWLEFGGNPVYYPRNMPFVLDSPLTIWAIANQQQQKQNASASSSKKGTNGQKTTMSNDKNGGSQSAKSNGSSGNDNDKSRLQEKEPEQDEADAYILLQGESRLKLVLNHYQYLFLMHTLDNLTKFTEQLDKDYSFFTHSERDSGSVSFCGLFPDVDLSLILPTQPPLSPYQDQQPDAADDDGQRSPTPDIDALEREDTLDGNDEGFGHKLIGGQQNPPLSSSGVVVEEEGLEEALELDDNADDPRILSSVNGGGQSAVVLPQQISSEPLLPSPAVTAVPPVAVAQEEFPVFPTYQDIGEVGSVVGDEVMSIATDTSDDDQFVLLENADNNEFDDVFTNRPPINNNNNNQQQQQLDSYRIPSPAQSKLLDRVLNEKVSLVTVHLHSVEVAFGAVGPLSAVYLQSSTLDLNEMNGISLREVIERMNSKKPSMSSSSSMGGGCNKTNSAADGLLLSMAGTNAGSSGSSEAKNTVPPLSLNILSQGSAEKSKLLGCLSGLNARLSNTNLANLAGFLEDDGQEPAAADVRIQIQNSRVQIYENEKPDVVNLFTNDTSIVIGDPPELPVHSCPKAISERKQAQLKAENDDLKQKLAQAMAVIQKLAKNTHQNNSQQQQQVINR